jgi:hypothetical protein
MLESRLEQLRAVLANEAAEPDGGAPPGPENSGSTLSPAGAEAALIAWDLSGSAFAMAVRPAESETVRRRVLPLHALFGTGPGVTLEVVARKLFHLEPVHCRRFGAAARGPHAAKGHNRHEVPRPSA